MLTTFIGFLALLFVTSKAPFPLMSTQDMHNKLKNGVPVDPQNLESISLSPGDRSALVNNFSFFCYRYSDAL